MSTQVTSGYMKHMNNSSQRQQHKYDNSFSLQLADIYIKPNNS